MHRGALTLVLVAALAVLSWWWLLGPGLEGALPDYTVLNRLSDPSGTMADVLVPSLSRESHDREHVFRAIATAERLDIAFFFSTQEAVDAHQALLPSPSQRVALGAGFLGQLRDGTYTGGEEIYPSGD